MIHKHPTVRKGSRMTHKWNIEYFCRKKLILSNGLYYNKMYGYTIEQYVEKQVKKNEKKLKGRKNKEKNTTMLEEWKPLPTMNEWQHHRIIKLQLVKGMP